MSIAEEKLLMPSGILREGLAQKAGRKGSDVMQRAIMPKIQSLKINNSKVMYYLLGEKDLFGSTGKVLSLNTSRAFVQVDLSKRESDINSTSKITQYDRAVMDAVYTLFIYGAKVFTPEMVGRVMCGDLESDITMNKVERISISIEKLAGIHISLDCTTEMVQRKIIKSGEQQRYEGYLLPVKGAKVLSGNHRLRGMDAYVIEGNFPLYQYADQVSQIISIPIDVLKACKTVSNTDETIVLKRYLIQRIEAMKNQRNSMSSKVISYEWYDAKKGEYNGLLHALGYKQDDYKQWRIKRNEIHKKVLAILSDLEKEKYIHGWKVNVEGKQKITGVTILLKAEYG